MTVLSTFWHYSKSKCVCHLHVYLGDPGKCHEPVVNDILLINVSDWSTMLWNVE